MFTRDYVMRQIQQLSQVLALVLFKKRENPEVETAGIVSEGLRETLGVSLEEVLAMDETKIITLCSENGHFSPELAVSIADLLVEDRSELAQQRSFWLYTEAARAGGALPIHALEWISDKGQQ